MCCVLSAPTPKLPKIAVDRQEHHDNGTPRVLGVPHTATPSPMYLGASLQPEPTTTLFIFTTTTVTSSTTNQALYLQYIFQQRIFHHM